MCSEQLKWIVFANTYNPNERRWELEIVLSITDPAHPTSPNGPAFAEKVAFAAAYIPGTMEEMHDGGPE